MIEDMRMRKLEPRTQEGYSRAVRKLTVFLKRSPDTATVEVLRNFQLDMGGGIEMPAVWRTCAPQYERAAPVIVF